MKPFEVDLSLQVCPFCEPLKYVGELSKQKKISKDVILSVLPDESALYRSDEMDDVWQFKTLICEEFEAVRAMEDSENEREYYKYLQAHLKGLYALPVGGFDAIIARLVQLVTERFQPRERPEGYVADVQVKQERSLLKRASNPPALLDSAPVLKKKRPKLYCLCRQGEGPEMVCCDQCEEWFHFECVGLPVGTVLDEQATFNCPICRGEVEQPEWYLKHLRKRRVQEVCLLSFLV